MLQFRYRPAVKSTCSITDIRRADRLDTLRGVALVWMAGFHFCFDLSHLGLIQANFYRDPVWTLQRAAIVSLFIFSAGLGQALAVANGQTWSRFWSRWWQIAACALLVTLGSWWMFPQSFITFGVLHGIALMLILTRFLALRAWPLSALWCLGLVCLLLPRLVSSPVFDSRWTQWIGLVTRLPRTEDYVPLLPWWGVMLWGLAAGQWVLRHRAHWLMAPLPAWPGLSWLGVLGCWSLSFYMIHQPLMLGGLMWLAPLLSSRL